MSPTEKHYRLNKPLILAIVGISGSGKSTLEKNLLEEYPYLFSKLQQFSTRNMRNNEKFGDPYIFVQSDTFDYVAEKLIGVIGTKPDSLFPNKYGSLPDFVEGKISTIILAEEGIKDLNYKVNTVATKSSPLGMHSIFTIGLDVDYDHLSHEDRQNRVGRDDAFLEKERAVLKFADAVFKNRNGKYVCPDDIIQFLVENSYVTETESDI